MQITINPETLQLLPGSEVFFSQQGWSDYEFLLELRQEKTLPKIYFNARSQIVRLLSPDLALEVDLTSHTNPADYHPLGILELWIYRLGGLFIYLWQESGYQESFASQIFPEFDVKNILPDYVELAWQKGCSFTLREFNKYLQNR